MIGINGTISATNGISGNFAAKIAVLSGNVAGSSGLSPEMIHWGSSDYWNSLPDMVGQKSHIYIYSDYWSVTNDGKSVLVPNIKIGDGSAFLIDNPFITDSVEELCQMHIEDEIRHITEEERTVWNNKVRCYLSTVEGETIVFTTN